MWPPGRPRGGRSDKREEKGVFLDPLWDTLGYFFRTLAGKGVKEIVKKRSEGILLRVFEKKKVYDPLGEA